MNIRARPQRSCTQKSTTTSMKSPYFEDESGFQKDYSSGDEFQAPKEASKHRNRRVLKRGDARSCTIKKRKVEPNKVAKSSNKRKSALGSSQKHKISPLEDHIKPETDTEADSSSSENWEDVHVSYIECTTKEEDFMHPLLSCPENYETKPELQPETLTIVLDRRLQSGNKTKHRDPEVTAALLRNKLLRETHRDMHAIHLLGLLTHGRYLNRSCDDTLIRGLGFSLLSSTNLIQASGRLLSPSEWTLDEIQAILTEFCCLPTDKPPTPDRLHGISRGVAERLNESHSTSTDVVMLLVATLRALGLDARLVCVLYPISLKPLSDKTTGKKTSTSKHLGPEGRRNDEFVPVPESEVDASPSLTAGKANIDQLLCFGEVYLPSIKSTAAFDLKPPVGRVFTPSACLQAPYIVGFSSTRPLSPNERPYAGRSPSDLSSRYDSGWMHKSRSQRVLSALWTSLLSRMRLHCDLDAARWGVLEEYDAGGLLEMRDQAQSRETLELLRNQPLPTSLQEFKNHPLYALTRHLLKFEVIYPYNLAPVGHLRCGKSNTSPEPIYPRECVFLCHTRENWLKEAKVVRAGEKPAKVVKAIMSMKRKLLLDGSGPVPTVEVFGPWQVEEYTPPIAHNGIVPRNEYGNVELFKPCMLPVGCVHIRLSGIQHIAKRLGIDIAQAMIGWQFHGGGWAHPQFDGYVACKECVPALLRSWHEERMDKAKAARADKQKRALYNWRRLTLQLRVWHRVVLRFNLAQPTGGASVAPATRGTAKRRRPSRT